MVGETPNLAARLQDLAAPDSIVISESANALVSRRFETEAIGNHRLKGFSNPVTAWRVMQERSSGSLFEARNPQVLSRIVGREEEVELLKRRWQRAQSGGGQVVMLCGEPGIGKSRLTEVMREEVPDHLQLRYQCSPYYSNNAFFPVVHQLKRTAEISNEDDRQQILAKISNALRLQGSASGHPR